MCLFKISSLSTLSFFFSSRFPRNFQPFVLKPCSTEDATVIFRDAAMYNMTDAGMFKKDLIQRSLLLEIYSFEVQFEIWGWKAPPNLGCSCHFGEKQNFLSSSFLIFMKYISARILLFVSKFVDGICASKHVELSFNFRDILYEIENSISWMFRSIVSDQSNFKIFFSWIFF